MNCVSQNSYVEGPNVSVIVYEDRIFMEVCSLSCVRLFATPGTVAHQAPLSMEFSRQEYWSGLPFPTPGDLPDPRIEPASLMSPTLESRFFTTSSPGKPFVKVIKVKWDHKGGSLIWSF